MSDDLSNFPIALVVEGGGMRGAYASGVLSALQRHDVQFDAVYGTPSGGTLVAWFAAGQAKEAERIWTFATDRRILSYRRLFSRTAPLLDYDRLFLKVFRDELSLDVSAIAQSRSPVIVTATDIDSASCAYVDVRREDVLLWLLATNRFPFGCGPPVAIGGRSYLDGGILDPIPVDRAIRDGARRVVVVLNRPATEMHDDPRIVTLAAAHRFPSLRAAFLERGEQKRKAIALSNGPPEGVRVHVIQPDPPTGLRRLTRDTPHLAAGLEQGRRDGDAFASAMTM